MKGMAVSWVRSLPWYFKFSFAIFDQVLNVLGITITNPMPCHYRGYRFYTPPWLLPSFFCDRLDRLEEKVIVDDFPLLSLMRQVT